MKLFCGIDWAESHHDVAVVDGDGLLVAKLRIDDSAEGFGKLLGLLAESGDTLDEPDSRGDRRPHAACWSLLCADRGETSMPSTPWRWPATAIATRWPGKSPITWTR